MRGAKPSMKIAAAPVARTPKAPAWLAATARAEWRRVAPILTERRILTEADLGSLENYCVATGQIRDCQTLLSGLDSPFFTGESGVPRPHPAIRVQHAAITLARQLAAELGLTPVSRSRPAINDDAEDNGGFGDLVD